MKKFGYDSLSKSLFSWNGDFLFDGQTDVPPDGTPAVTECFRKQYEMLGCYFLSGFCRDAIIYRFDGDDVSHMAGFVFGDRCAVAKIETREAYGLVAAKMYPICICGPDCRNPRKISEICRRFPSSAVYVCQVVDELAALGLLVSGLNIRPRRTPLCQPNISTVEPIVEEFDPTLAGDGMGRMANYLKHGVPVLNDMMKCVGISPFYGKVLTGNGTGTFIVRSCAIDRYFPSEPISLKKYAATSVPVEVKNTASFSGDSGFPDETVVILASSDYIPDLPIFMNFHHLMSGKEFVVTARREDFDKALPVFAYNRAYRR